MQNSLFLRNPIFFKNRISKTLCIQSFFLEIRFFSKIGFLKSCVFRVLQEPQLSTIKTMIKHISFLLLAYCIITISPTFANGDLTLNDGRTVKLSPETRILKRKQSIPTVKMGVIQAFLNRPQLITEEEIEHAPSIIANVEQSLFSTKGNKIYVDGINNGQIGQQYLIVRLGKTYRSPLEDEEDEILAYEAIHLGEAILKVNSLPAILEITSAVDKIKAGDRLLPLEEDDFQGDLYPHSPKKLEDAYIIGVVGETAIISQYQIVVINRGSNEGIERGHQLAILKGQGRFQETIDSVYFENIEDEQNQLLLKQRAGTLLVFRVFERISYALVISAFLPINLLDIVTIP